MEGWIDGIDRWMDRWNRSMDGWMEGWMDRLRRRSLARMGDGASVRFVRGKGRYRYIR